LNQEAEPIYLPQTNLEALSRDPRFSAALPYGMIILERVTEKMNDSIMIYVIVVKDYESHFLNLGAEFIAPNYGN
jgi:hypothetical protein